MPDDAPAPLAVAVQRLASVHAVVRFEPGGVLRCAAEHPQDGDDRVVVRIPGSDTDWEAALCAGAELLVNDLRAVAARRLLRVVE